MERTLHRLRRRPRRGRREAPARPHATRPVDIVYRARNLPFHVGHHGQLKHEIARHRRHRGARSRPAHGHLDRHQGHEVRRRMVRVPGQRPLRDRHRERLECARPGRRHPPLRGRVAAVAPGRHLRGVLGAAGAGLGRLRLHGHQPAPLRGGSDQDRASSWSRAPTTGSSSPRRTTSRCAATSRTCPRHSSASATRPRPRRWPSAHGRTSSRAAATPTARSPRTWSRWWMSWPAGACAPAATAARPPGERSMRPATRMPRSASARPGWPTAPRCATPRGLAARHAARAETPCGGEPRMTAPRAVAGRQPALARVRQHATAGARALPAHCAGPDAIGAAPEGARAGGQRHAPRDRLLERRLQRAAGDPPAVRRRGHPRQHAARCPLGARVRRTSADVRLAGRPRRAEDRLPAGRVQPCARAGRLAGRPRHRRRLLGLRARAPRAALPAPRHHGPLREVPDRLRGRARRYPPRGRRAAPRPPRARSGVPGAGTDAALRAPRPAQAHRRRGGRPGGPGRGSARRRLDRSARCRARRPLVPLRRLGAGGARQRERRQRDRPPR